MTFAECITAVRLANAQCPCRKEDSSAGQLNIDEGIELCSLERCHRSLYTLNARLWGSYRLKD